MFMLCKNKYNIIQKISEYGSPESELGCSLFLASGRGLVVSDQGMRVYEASKTLLNEVVS